MAEDQDLEVLGAVISASGDEEPSKRSDDEVQEGQHPRIVRGDLIVNRGFRPPRGDFLEVTGTVTRVGNTSRTVSFEARKVIASRYDLGPSAADVLAEPIVTCRAIGTTVVPKANSRKLAAAGPQ